MSSSSMIRGLVSATYAPTTSDRVRREPATIGSSGCRVATECLFVRTVTARPKGAGSTPNLVFSQRIHGLRAFGSARELTVVATVAGSASAPALAPPRAVSRLVTTIIREARRATLFVHDSCRLSVQGAACALGAGAPEGRGTGVNASHRPGTH